MISRPTPGSQPRSYRMLCAPRHREISFQTVVEETDLFLVAEQDLTGEVLESVRHLRSAIKSYMTLHPDFAASLFPVEVSSGAPEIVQEMAEAARICGVGPMAAVAGAIAQRVADRLVDKSPNILVENGGDIYMHSTRERIIGVLPVPEQDMQLGIRVHRKQFPCALCGSSGTIGHSLSLGNGDLVVVRAGTGALADAAATALSNLIRKKQDVNLVLKRAQELSGSGILGVLAQMGENFGVWGDLELTEI